MFSSEDDAKEAEENLDRILKLLEFGMTLEEIKEKINEKAKEKE